MSLYAQRGIRDWAAAPSALRSRAQTSLGAQIADTPVEAQRTINTVYDGLNGDKLHFIPMPVHPSKTGLDRCFFLPLCEVSGSGVVKVNFELFILVNGLNCLAFRFEHAHPASFHDYGHVQMTKRLVRKTIMANTLPWIPDRYPAFPLGTSDPLRMFLGMAIAVHGHTGGLTYLLQDMFMKASRPGEAAMYLDELKAFLV